MRLLFTLWLALAGIAPAAAQVTFGLSSGPVSIGINVPVYPNLVPVPGYPVYYAPTLGTNYFFYDGLYWVFQNGGWYESNWYNGPWYPVAPDAVPVYLLRVPVRYYHHPPAFFRGWRADAAPHWDEHWGRGWAEHHADWNHYDRAHGPARAPLPAYQRRYSGNNYPHDQAQAAQHGREYHYQPRDQVVQQHYERHQQAYNGNSGRDSRGNGQAHEQRGNGQQAHEQRGNGQGHEQRGGQGHERPADADDHGHPHGSGG
ncbi:MAG TPA: hypothetical protein VFE23_17275 [Usitatibacter sp.]|jgi:hypothetical protein|nr:hypothetical protein [Usitatibacter sp.]